ncbi:uncharacterized protein FIESC28_05950 [Fusarium coffeatum]|uniref:2EXR domain-containing protein n=1 Tax=Fusarium coffeatum TaxID=231269 RepID=A0A366RNH1_9HYPO|nr:uncharacterized protein FIESC28_05950 [Fusarium coffeatum]RBR18673.1 hypothetical protein FIESC28_05950 [Fusarium coffeatum]
MCSPYFRQFPELPAELRLQIWQEACLSFPPSRRGLQYVTVQQKDYDIEAAAIPCDWPSWPRSLSQNTNRSAYFLNGGLWKACKESRQVIAAHTEYYRWLQIHRQPIQDTRELIRRQPSSSRIDLIHILRDLPLEKAQNQQPSSHHGPPPAIIDYDGEGGEECRMLVYPSRDMFCIKVDDWKPLRRGRYPDIQMPFIRYNDDDEDYFQWWSHNRYRSLFKQPNIQDIALEFDPSWVTDIPDFYLDMMRENSARGYLVDWLYENAILCDEGLSIIDDEAKWFAKRPAETVYRDFDTEYIKISWEDVADYTYEGHSPNAAAFMNKIRHYEDDIYPEPESYGYILGPWGPYFRDVINLVVCRDNEASDVVEQIRTLTNREDVDVLETLASSYLISDWAV